MNFFEELYPDKPDDSYLLLWQKKKSFWFQDLTKAANFVTNHPDDIYYGVGLSPKNCGQYKRCKASNILGIPGLWADIDVGPGKKNYPPTIEDAEKLIDEYFPKPTMVVSSGGGMHAYWFFKEFLIFESEEERAAAEQMNKRLNKDLNQKAAKNGWELDNVGDLARILRPPGSFNCKEEQKKQVTVIRNDGPRYQYLSDFDEFLPELPAEPKVPDPPRKTLEFYQHANPPADKFTHLIEEHPEFKNLWEKKFKNGKDTSPSGWDFELAKYSIRALWGDQAIANLLISFRKKHDVDLKRPDYYERTIANARKAVAEEDAQEQIERSNVLSGTEYEDPEDLKKNLAALSQHLITNIKKIVRFQADKVYYRFITDDISVKIDSTKVLLSQINFQASWAEQTKIVIRKVNQTQWENLVQIILKCSENDSEDPEASADTRIVAWIREYLLESDIVSFHFWEKSVDQEFPFVKDVFWHIKVECFRRWSYYKKEYLGKGYELSKEMREVKCQVSGFTVRIFDPGDETKVIKRATRNFRIIPHEIAHPEKMEDLLNCPL